MALLLARPRVRFPSNPSLIHHFSTSRTDTPPENGAGSSENDASQSSSSSSPQASFSSFFSDVRASLSQTQQKNNVKKAFSGFDNRPQNPSPFSSFNNRSSGEVASPQEIRRNLAGFQRRSTVDSSAAQSQSSFSFSELYKRNVMSKQGDSAVNAADSGLGRGGKPSMDAIRESLKRISHSVNSKTERIGPTPLPFSGFRDRLKTKPNDDVRSNVIGGTGALPISVFGKEIEERKAEKGREGGKETMKTEFVKTYSYEELGTKLGMLRPEGKKEEGWFSLQELNDRLIKLRETEEKELQSRIGGVPFSDLRSSLERLKVSNEEAKQKTSLQRLDILSHIGATPSFMLQPPKEHLVETYFHPDNMSSAEKMKIELAKVRDEFKMSESDCGSARVQVAQLTTKIKHLSSVLHKKDKHSKKGLLAMVQNRKKLLKYLRRTDWDSYCLVLSKLGLRDNPDYKN